MQRLKVKSEPLKQLVGEGRNEKYVRECTELHLGYQGIEEIDGFERLKNLEVLWLNDNKLTNVTKLDANFRIKELYLHNNNISSLKGSIRKCTFLQKINLENNNLSNLHKILETFHSFQFLKELVLKGNPCCLESDYRMHTISMIPSLHVLDYHVVTDIERTAIQSFLGIGLSTEKLAFGKAAIPRKGMWSVKVPEVSKLETTLRRSVENLKEQEKSGKDVTMSQGQFGRRTVEYNADILEGVYKPKDVFTIYSWKLGSDVEDTLKKKSPAENLEGGAMEQIANADLDIHVSTVDV